MSRKRSVLTINDEIRRLQRTLAVLVCIQAAAAEDTEADLGDALAVIVALVSIGSKRAATGRCPMDASKPDAGAEPGLETIHEATQSYFRLMGKRINQMRRAREMSQVEVGRILGVSQQTVFNIEIGERRLRLDLLPVLARAFGVTADELLGLKPMPPLKESPIPERLLRHLEILKTLSEGDQRFILKLAETMALR